MSFILDALKKAESERALGSVPDIHARPIPLVAIDDRPALWRRPVVWIAAGAALILTGLVWLEPWRSAPPPVTAAPPMQIPPPQAPAPAPQPAAAPVSPPPAAAAPAPTPRPVPARVEPVQPKAQPKPKEKAAVTAVAPAAPAPAPTPAPAPAPAPKSAAVAVPPPVIEPRAPTLRELPENIQREIPAIAIGGYIYASKPSERSVLINSRLLREGDQIAPGLVLETMMPREAVLNYRGYRYRVPY